MSLEFGVRLLLIEDEPDLAASMARGLRGQGYAVDWTPDGVEGLQMLDVDQYDLLVLDLGLPSMDGLEVLHRIRDSLPELMILVVTARSLPQQRARGLDLGADDYLVKPFHFEELCARLRALLRRDLRARSPVLQTGDLTLDPAQRRAFLEGRPLELSRKAVAVLEYLMRRPGEVITQEELLDHVWDAQVNPVTNVLPVHINALRHALGEDARHPRYIRTVVGEGYMLVPVDADE